MKYEHFGLIINIILIGGCFIGIMEVAKNLFSVELLIYIVLFC